MLVRCILPKLELEMKKFVVNPQQQNLDTIQCVLRWQGMIPEHHLVVLFQNEFFPKWLKVLQAWLSNSPNYDEIARWYLNWKQLLEPLVKNKMIQGELNRAMMNEALSGEPVTIPPMPLADKSFKESRRI
eukprot:TRINITY_DN3462_c0_g1_i2.p1 TRINITY_DN3462_c0_g1~~TRINITY_DN3462_c0_g1_i2.p1  ORF type:complete len:130 (+),score=14.97 TRINITY_DN3462_c0_g1_i2:119-508(+)